MKVANNFLLPMLLSVIYKRAMSCATNVSGIYSLVFVTVPEETIASTIAKGLVQNKLAACVNIIPGIKSVYEWEGQLCEDAELILKIKTRTNLVPKVTDYVVKAHPYDVPEVVSVPIDNGNPDYLSWIGKTLADGSNTEGKE